MARSRNIKPGFFENEDLAELPFHTRLLFIGLWTLADRNGRLEDRPKRIMMQLFPLDSFDVDESLEQLVEAGFIVRYGQCERRIKTAHQRQYIQVINFEKHQSPHKTEKDGTIPSPSDIGASTEEESLDNGAITVKEPDNNESTTVNAGEDTVALPPDSLIHRFSDSPNHDSLIEDSPNHEKETPNTNVTFADAKRDQQDGQRVFDCWREVHGHPRAKFDDKRKRLVRARLKDGYTADELIEAIHGCKRSPFHQGDNKDGTVHDRFDLILRNADQIDKFRKLYHQPDMSGMSAAARRTANNLMDWVEGSGDA